MRQKHQHPSGNADLCGQPGALAADGVLDHLHQQRLPRIEQFFDGAGGAPFLDPALPQVGHVQEGRTFQSDVDERRLHARQHPVDDAGVDVAHLATAGLTVDVEFLQHPLLDQGNPGLGRGGADQYFFFYGVGHGTLRLLSPHGIHHAAAVAKWTPGVRPWIHPPVPAARPPCPAAVPSRRVAAP